MAEENSPPLGTDDPEVLTNPGQSPPLPYEPVQNTTTNNAPLDDLMSWGSKQLLVAYIKVNDILPPKGSKRYNRYIALYRSTDTLKSVTLQFKGSSSAMGTTEDMVEKPVLADGIQMLHEMSEAKGALVVDSEYEIKLLSLQSTRVDATHPGQTTTFTFNNGAEHDVDYPGLAVQNIHLAFDVINTMPTLGCMVRFDVKVLINLK